MKFQTQRHSVQKVFYQIQSTICGVNFSNNISITQVKVNERKTKSPFTWTWSELKSVWNLTPPWKVVPFTWQFHCGNVQMVALN